MDLQYLVAIVVIIVVFWPTLMGTILDYRKRKEMFMLHHQERMAAIEKGIELPPLPESFFKEESKDNESGKARSLHNDLGWGLFWLLGGLALFVALYFNFNGKIALYALIPLAVGLHYLIYYYVIGKKEAAAWQAERKAKAAEASQMSAR